MRMTILCTLLIALGLPLACSRAQETAEDAASVAGQAADAVTATAQDAADLVDDPVAKCSELASKGAWSEALEACTKAHEAQPDNMFIEHALQQAKAAAEQ